MGNIGSSRSIGVVNRVHIPPPETCAIGNDLGIQVFVLFSTEDSVESMKVSVNFGVKTGVELEVKCTEEL